MKRLKDIDWMFYVVAVTLAVFTCFLVAAIVYLVVDTNYRARNDPPGMTCSPIGSQRVCVSEVPND